MYKNILKILWGLSKTMDLDKMLGLDCKYMKFDAYENKYLA